MRAQECAAAFRNARGARARHRADPSRFCFRTCLMNDADSPRSNFIRELILADNASGKHGGRVHTRFPPEPNGYLHVGHAKSIMLNFGLAEEFGGKCNLRFDDTNPTKEEQEYVESIIEDVKWLGGDFGDRLFYASDYFQRSEERRVGKECRSRWSP